MKITKTFLMLSMVSVLMFMSLASAGDFRLNFGGNQIFTVATDGDVNASGNIYENNVLLTDIYVTLTGANALTGVLSSTANITTTASFVGSGEFLTGITVDDNAINIAGENITSGTIAEARLPTTIYTIELNASTIDTGTIGETYLPDTIYTIALNASEIAVGTIDFARLPSLTNLVSLDYHNITGIPNCNAGEFLKFGGTDLTCESASAADYTNIAYFNDTVTWAEDQVFTSDINVTAGSSINLLANTSSIKRGSTNMTIDSSGNVDFWLG